MLCKLFPVLVNVSFPYRADYERLFGVTYCNCEDMTHVLRMRLVEGVVDCVLKSKQPDEQVDILSFGSGYLGVEFFIFTRLKSLGYQKIHFVCIDSLYEPDEELFNVFSNLCATEHTQKDDTFYVRVGENFNQAVMLAGQWRDLSFMEALIPFNAEFYHLFGYADQLDSRIVQNIEGKLFFSPLVSSLISQKKLLYLSQRLVSQGMQLTFYSDFDDFNEESVVKPNLLFACDSIRAEDEVSNSPFFKVVKRCFHESPDSEMAVFIADKNCLGRFNLRGKNVVFEGDDHALFQAYQIHFKGERV